MNYRFPNAWSFSDLCPGNGHHRKTALPVAYLTSGLRQNPEQHHHNNHHHRKSLPLLLALSTSLARLSPVNQPKPPPPPPQPLHHFTSQDTPPTGASNPLTDPFPLKAQTPSPRAPSNSPTHLYTPLTNSTHLSLRVAATSTYPPPPLCPKPYSYSCCCSCKSPTSPSHPLSVITSFAAAGRDHPPTHNKLPNPTDPPSVRYRLFAHEPTLSYRNTVATKSPNVEP
ncbi:hypothetical protein BZA05DRAFT_55846 [Tricharina praecox]|uniref:uncharacterized protein n=1 Tax=Tricharina praecox TaxID=43433 RepID=UPI00221F21FB|nr:uncharacterized protein BZA05DRAFT_55846 [Tricharina praecox]KAI5850984.1 hypothetical protein BZA05DRAFT_55846 [Tricharina praecox]